VLRETSRTAPEDVRLNPDVRGSGLSHDHVHDHDHEHDHDHDHDHDHVEAAPPTVPSRAVVINVGVHTGALVLASNEERSGIEIEIHPVSRPDARTHVWVLPREVRDGIVYAAIFPSLESGDYAILSVDGSIVEIVSVPPNQVTHATWM
jgi:ABC-type Zn2+ transport system substrate-binding protein/surface adhesin